MRDYALLFMRVTLGWLLVVWGVDKLHNVGHAVRVSEGFYLGMLTGANALKAFGAVQIVAGLLVVLGLARRVAYPFLLAVTGVTLIAVWKSIIDPWGLFLTGGNLVFYSSAIIFACALGVYAFRDDDKLSLDARRGSRAGQP